MLKFSKMIIVIFCLAMIFAATKSANAGGSVGFDEVVQNLAGQSPELMAEVHIRLSNENLKISDIVCVGLRLGRHWVHLGGLRIPTFRCAIGAQTLTIDGDVSFYDVSGKVDAGPEDAMYVAMSNPKWSWASAGGGNP